MNNLSIALPIFFSKPVAKRAFKVAITVGTILAFINHGDTILLGNLTPECWIKIICSAFIPFCVSSVTATLGIIEQRASARPS